MTITVSILPAPTALNASLTAGGSLVDGTTYYYVVIAYDQRYISPYASWSNRFGVHSSISAEDSFTCDATNKSANITWTNATGATRYQILVSTTSGDYTNSGGYGTVAESVGAIADGSTGYSLTALSTEQVIFHSCQLVNDQAGDIDKDQGMLMVDFTGTDTHDLDDVYDAIVAAGYSTYVSYDGYNFVMKGWLRALSTCSDTGMLWVKKKRLTFPRGGISVRNANYTFRFGTWVTDEIQANYADGCAIDIQGGRYPISGTSGNLQLYGSLVTFQQSIITAVSENLLNQYYTGGSQVYFNSNVSKYQDSLFGANGTKQFRGTTSEIKDIKFECGNNYGNPPHIRLRLPRPNSCNMPYTHLGAFYACDFMTCSTLRNYSFNNGAADITNFYDCDFTEWPDDMLKAPYMTYSNLKTAYNWQSLNYYDFVYSIEINVIDDAGTPLQGANVSLTDKEGDAGTWIEHDGTYDKQVTGSTYTTDRTSDVNGIVDYYVKSYHNYLNPAHTDTVTDPDTSTNSLTTEYFPFTIMVSKAGYTTQTVILDDFTAKASMIITLKTSPKFTLSTEGKISKYLDADNPKNFGVILPLTKVI